MLQIITLLASVTVSVKPPSQAASAPQNHPFHENVYTEGSPAPIEASGVHAFKLNHPCAVSVAAEEAQHGRFGPSQGRTFLCHGMSLLGC